MPAPQKKTYAEVKTYLAVKYEQAAMRSKSKTRAEKWRNKAQKYRFQAKMAGA